MTVMTVGNGSVLLWMLEFFFFVIWFWLLLGIFSDLFRDHELSGAWKAVWVVVLVLFPYLGILVYLIARGRGMTERGIKANQVAQEQLDARIRAAAGSGGSDSAADQIAKAKGLLDSGAIDQAEFDALKALSA
jgi:hypothetical protein